MTTCELKIRYVNEWQEAKRPIGLKHYVKRKGDPAPFCVIFGALYHKLPSVGGKYRVLVWSPPDSSACMRTPREREEKRECGKKIRPEALWSGLVSL